MKNRYRIALAVMTIGSILISFTVMYLTLWLYSGKPPFFGKVLFISLPVSIIGPVSFCLLWKLIQNQKVQQDTKSDTSTL